MRHLNTEELLLYAENELGDAALCRHLQDCVDCKASLVEVQETFVFAATEIRASVKPQPVELQVASASRLQSAIADRLVRACEHLNSEELLLSSESELAESRQSHLDGCAKCQREAANMMVLLADIEAELRELMPDEPGERKAAALVALEKRLAEESHEVVVEEPTPVTVIEFQVERVKQYSAYAAAAAFLIWGGFQVSQTPGPLSTVAQFVPSEPEVEFTEFQPAPVLESATIVEEVERFDFVRISPESASLQQAPEFAPAPSVSGGSPDFDLIGQPEFNLQPPPAEETFVAVAEPTLPTETATEAFTVALNADRPVGGMVRNSLLAHYRDAARRSFQTPASSLLEAELERYVSNVLRSDTELLSHVHAIHSTLRSIDSSELAGSSDVAREMKFHLDGIANREAAIYADLSEVLPRRYWTYRGETGSNEKTADMTTIGEELLADALGLDEALTTLFVANTATFDARGNERSCGKRLARVRNHVARLRQAIR